MKAQVLLPKIFNFSFTYNSNNISLQTGDLVEVPFGKNKEVGVVWKNKNTDLKDITIKTTADGLKMFHEVLSGVKGAARNIVMLNAGATIYCAGIADSIEDGVLKAQQSIDSNNALQCFIKLKKISQEMQDAK